MSAGLMRLDTQLDDLQRCREPGDFTWQALWLLTRSEKAFGRGRTLMDARRRRAMLTNVLPGAVVAIAGVGTLGWAVAPGGADAMPLAVAKGSPVKVDDLVVKAQVGGHSRR